MNIETDISLNTLIISGVVALVGWALKGSMVVLGTIIKRAIETMFKTMAKVEMLDARLNEVIQTIGDVHKIRTDLNGFYSRLKALEDLKKTQ